MFIRLRKRFLNWLRESDSYAIVAEADEPIKATKGAWANAVNQIRVARPHHGALQGVSRKPNISNDSDGSLDSRSITFKVFPARGGMVIETYYYDEKSDNNKNSLHLIPESEDLAEAIAHIITMEAMRG